MVSLLLVAAPMPCRALTFLKQTTLHFVIPTEA
jgi:hypothetical protein